MTKADAMLVNGKDQAKIPVVSQGEPSPKIEMKRKLPMPPPFVVSNNYGPEYPWMGQPRPTPGKTSTLGSTLRMAFLIIVVVTFVSLLFYCGHRLLKWKNESEKEKAGSDIMPYRAGVFGFGGNTPVDSFNPEMLRGLQYPDQFSSRVKDLLEAEEPKGNVDRAFTGAPEGRGDGSDDGKNKAAQGKADKQPSVAVVPAGEMEHTNTADGAGVPETKAPSGAGDTDKVDEAQAAENQRRYTALLLRLLDLVRRVKVQEQQIKMYQRLRQEKEQQEQQQQDDSVAPQQGDLEDRKDVLADSDRTAGESPETDLELQRKALEAQQLERSRGMLKQRMSLLLHLLNQRQKQLEAREQQQRALLLLRLLDLQHQQHREEEELHRRQEEQRIAVAKLNQLREEHDVEDEGDHDEDEESADQEQKAAPRAPVFFFMRRQQEIRLGGEEEPQQESQQETPQQEQPAAVQDDEEQENQQGQGQDYRRVFLMLLRPKSAVAQEEQSAPQDQQEQTAVQPQQEKSPAEKEQPQRHVFLMLLRPRAQQESEVQEDKQGEVVAGNPSRPGFLAAPQLQEPEQANATEPQPEAPKQVPAPMFAKMVQFFIRKAHERQLALAQAQANSQAADGRAPVTTDVPISSIAPVVSISPSAPVAAPIVVQPQAALPSNLPDQNQGRVVLPLYSAGSSGAVWNPPVAPGSTCPTCPCADCIAAAAPPATPRVVPVMVPFYYPNPTS